MSVSRDPAALLDRRDLAPLRRHWAGWVDPGLAAAALEAAAALPLSPPARRQVAWQALGLFDRPIPGRAAEAVARVAVWLSDREQRRALHDIAADRHAPGHRAVTGALAEIGEEPYLAAEVRALLLAEITDRTAYRLATLPLERAPVSPARLPASHGSELTSLQSWWAAVAAARLGDVRGLDRWLDVLARTPGEDPLASDSRADFALREVLPLPAGLREYLSGRLVRSSPVHARLAAAWLPPQPGLPLGMAEARASYADWLTVGSPAGWTPTAARLARTGPADLVAALEPWIADLSDPAGARAACEAVRDAAILAGHTYWRPDPALVWDDRYTGPDEPLLPGPPPDGPRRGSGGDQPVRPLPRKSPPSARPTEGTPASRPPIPVPIPPPPSPGRAGSGGAGSGGAGQGRPVGPPMDSPVQPVGEGPPRTPAPPEPAPPAAYARLRCPAVVQPEQEFLLDVGLGRAPEKGVAGAALTLPARAAYRLTVLIVVDGFRVADGGPTVTLEVTPADPYPGATIALTAVDDPDLDEIRVVMAVFSVDGVGVGTAARAVRVVPAAANRFARREVPRPTGVPLSAPAPAAAAADLEVTISYGDDAAGRRLLWTYRSPHPEVADSPAAIARMMPGDGESFAQQLSRSVAGAADERLARLLRGAGGQIAGLVPGEVFEALRTVAGLQPGGRAPTLLLQSQEPHVPWELASVTDPWIDGVPALLGTQAAVGRWALVPTGSAPDPPRAVAMTGMAVVRGVYDIPGYGRLVWAEKEAEDLVAAYRAEPVEAARAAFYACLDGVPAAEVVHVALHGKFDPTGRQDGLILADGSVVGPWEISGSGPSPARPFVFLNACQVGQAGQMLGQYAGIAEAFVTAGASAVVAPLWVVDDEVARSVSLRFYESVFAGLTPAEFLREERGRAGGAATPLAYVLYGHPGLRLTRASTPQGEIPDGHPGP